MNGDFRDPAEEAARLGLVPRSAPSGQWGNGGPSGRAGTAISWSSANEKVDGFVGTGPFFKPILLFVSPDGQPNLWNVSVQLTPGPTNIAIGASRKDMALKLRWTIGALASEAVVDIAAANASFQLAADSVTVHLSNPARDVMDPHASDVVAAVAITHAAGVAAGRTARRTLYGDKDTVFIIPPWAQQVQFIPSENDFSGATYVFEIQDSGGATLEVVYVLTGTTSYTLVELPSSAARIKLVLGGSVKTQIGLCFVLGF